MTRTVAEEMPGLQAELGPEELQVWYLAFRGLIRAFGGLWQGKMVWEHRGQMLVFPEPHQEPFLYTSARHPCFLAGRGTGKSWTGLTKGVLYNLGHPGARGAVLAETYPQIEDIILPAMRDLFGPWEGKLWSYHVAAREIRFVNGSVILLLPAAEPDKLVGLTLAWFWMDEAKVGHQEMAFMMLIPCLRQAGYPHQGWVTTTPLGPSHWISLNWVKKVLSNGKQLPAKDYPLFQASMYDNEALDPETKKALDERYVGARARRELYGEVVAMEGQAFQIIDKHVRTMPLGLKVKRWLVGLDVGSASPTAAVELAVDESNHVWVTREFYKVRCDLRELLEVLGDWGRRVWCDLNGKDEISFLKKAGLPVQKARSNGFDLRYTNVSARLALNAGEPGLYIDPSCINLIDELQSLEFATHRGMTEEKNSWKQGLPDHAYDALAYALMEVDNGPLGVPKPSKSFSLTGLTRRWGHT